MSTQTIAPYAAPVIAQNVLRQAKKWQTFAELLRNPVFDGWDRGAGSAVSCNLVQLHAPLALEHNAGLAAARIARVLGGKWNKQGDKWEGQLAGDMAGLMVILHRVEPKPKPEPEVDLIDLSRYPEGEE